MENKDRYCSVEQSLIEAFKQVKDIRNDKLKRKTWDDFASEDDYKDKFSLLEENGKVFEKQLRETTFLVEGKFRELEELDINDFDTEEEFMRERKEIQDDIIDEAYGTLKDYIQS